MKKAIVTLLAAGMLLGSTTGCIGRMALSGKVLGWNLSVAESKWGREAVFLCLYIIPVYPISGLIDLLIINSIEFHSGTNPVSGEARLANRVKGPDGSVATSTPREDGSLDIEVVTADGERHFVNVVQDGDHVVARNEALEPVATVNDAGNVVPLAAAH